MKNAINWFELPTVDFDRALKFYSAVLDAELQQVEMGTSLMGFFPSKDQGVGGCIIKDEGYTPQANGTLVYLNGGDNLATSLARVETAGGSVVMPKTAIGENGFIAMFIDSEGNKVGFHSMN